MTGIRAIMRDNRERYGNDRTAWKDIENRGFLWRSTSGASFRNEFSEIFSRNLTARNSSPSRKTSPRASSISDSPSFHSFDPSLREFRNRSRRRGEKNRRCGNCVKASRRISITARSPSSLVVGKSSRHYIFALEYNRFGEFTLAKSPLSLLALEQRELSPPPRLLIFADNYRTGDPFNSASPRSRHVPEDRFRNLPSLLAPTRLDSFFRFEATPRCFPCKGENPVPTWYVATYRVSIGEKRARREGWGKLGAVPRKPIALFHGYTSPLELANPSRKAAAALLNPR